MSRRSDTFLIPSIKLDAWFHAYIACTIIGIRWGKFSPTSANGDKELGGILREYLTFACGDDEWTKGRILEAMRFKTGIAMKADARLKFPSLFPRNRKARPLAVPEELKDVSINFDLERIHKWRRRVRAIKKERVMNETTNEVGETTEEVASNSVTPAKKRSVKVNFVIPQGVDPSTITLTNYREITNARFRMTKDQAEVRGLSREEAFEESKSLALAQLREKEL